jgi:hypothetical protein
MTDVLEQVLPVEAVAPIAQALLSAASRDDTAIDQLPAATRQEYLALAERLLATAMADLVPRVKFNLRLVAQIRAVPDEVIMQLTQPPITLSIEGRRAMFVRALRMAGADEAPARPA